MAEQAEEPKKSGKGLIIILIVVVLLLVIGMGVMAMLLLGKSSDQPANGDASAPPPTEQIQYSAAFKQYPPLEPNAPPLYFEMKFVVNFKGEGKARFLGVDLKFMSRYPGVIEDMEHIRPILLNDITLLLRQQTYTELSQDNGPEVLREKILAKAREAAESNGIYPDLINNVFLTRFVMQ